MNENLSKAFEKIESQKKQIKAKERIIREREKRKEIEQLSEVGKLAYKANIHKIEKNILLGAFLDIFDKVNNDDFIKMCREKSLNFSQLEKGKENPISISFKESPSKEIKNLLKNMGFRWNAFRKEFYGFSSKIVLEKILLGIEFSIEEINK